MSAKKCKGGKFSFYTKGSSSSTTVSNDGATRGAGAVSSTFMTTREGTKSVSHKVTYTACVLA